MLEAGSLPCAVVVEVAGQADHHPVAELGDLAEFGAHLDAARTSLSAQAPEHHDAAVVQLADVQVLPPEVLPHRDHLFAKPALVLASSVVDGSLGAAGSLR